MHDPYLDLDNNSEMLNTSKFKPLSFTQRPAIVFIDVDSHSLIRTIGGFMEGDIPFMVDFAHQVFVGSIVQPGNSSDPLRTDELAIGEKIIQTFLPYTRFDNPIKIGSGGGSELYGYASGRPFSIEPAQYEHILSCGIPLPTNWRRYDSDLCSYNRFYSSDEKTHIIIDKFGNSPFIHIPRYLGTVDHCTFPTFTKPFSEIIIRPWLIC